MEAVKSVQQAFGSPGGKSYLAPRIAGMIPPHETYVEPFAGGAAVFFKKEPSAKEVLSDKDKGIAFAFRFLRDMTEPQFERLQKKNWVASRRQFGIVKAMKPKDDVERFYRFLYLKRFSYGSGMTQPHPIHCADDGGTRARIKIERFWRIHERLRRTRVHNDDAIGLINKYDSPHTFFYLDPPYPGRAFVGQTFDSWEEGDLKALIERLRGIKGSFALSLGVEHSKLIPKNWHIRRVQVSQCLSATGGDFNQTGRYEIIVTNYKPSDAKNKLRGFRSEPVSRGRLLKHLRRRHNGKRQLYRSAVASN